MSPFLTKWNVFTERIKITRLLSTNPESLLRTAAVKELKRITRKQEKYKSLQENTSIHQWLYSEQTQTKSSEHSLKEINDADFLTWLSRKRNTDDDSWVSRKRKQLGVEKIEFDRNNVKMELWKKWKRDLGIATDLLDDFDEEDFVSWIKQKPNRDLVNIELDQDRVSTVSDEGILNSWMKWRKNLLLAESQKNLALATKQETLNLVIEVAAEASLQFFIQVLLVLPDLIPNSLHDDQKSFFDTAKDMLNWKVVSILSSFATMANSYSRIQILEKEYALSWTGNPKALLILFFFTTLNTICRMMVFGCFIYFTNSEGHFDIVKALGLYYGHVLILLFFNIIFNRSSPSLSISYIISILLNSMTSFYSYNHYDFFNVQNKHKPTFLRQVFYFLIIMTENVALTTYFALYSSSYSMEGSYGVTHNISKRQIINMVIFIVILQTISVILNILYYANHTASVSVTNLQDKMQIYILGVSWIRKNGRWSKEHTENNSWCFASGFIQRRIFSKSKIVMIAFVQ